MNTVLNRPKKAEQKFAKEIIDMIEKALGNHKPSSQVYLSFQSKGGEESHKVPDYIVQCLKLLLVNIAEGRAMQFGSVETELSTQEAADMLGVSRPFVVKQLEQGAIPFRKIGTHRRIDLADLQAYQKKQKAVREKGLSFLAGQAQDLNLGYQQ